ncbi:MAG: hypothetical protein Q4C04_05415 [Clostridia bacterium]|nr:hypothetical protein [Clostridia bacterium]
MIWKRIRKSTRAEDAELRERMSSENVPAKDKAVMIITAFFVIVIPCALVLIGMSLLMLWIFGAL